VLAALRRPPSRPEARSAGQAQPEAVQAGQAP
jgi:hypothetical protein